jgi:hypothetical protein
VQQNRTIGAKFRNHLLQICAFVRHAKKQLLSERSGYRVFLILSKSGKRICGELLEKRNISFVTGMRIATQTTRRVW